MMISTNNMISESMDRKKGSYVEIHIACLVKYQALSENHIFMDVSTNENKV